MIKRTLAAISALTIAGTASADEAWTTAIGDVIYERDLPNGMTVLSFPVYEGEDEPRGLAYLDGLAGVFEGRGAYDGIWIEPAVDGGHTCAFPIANPETGEPEYNWGRTELIFVQPDYPGSWVARRGYCFEEPTEILIGHPLLGD